MKAAVFHQPNVPVLMKDLEIEALQESESLLDVVTAGVSHSNYHLIHGHRTPKEVKVYGSFLAG